MAESTITALPSTASVDPADVLPVDNSTGTATQKITVQQAVDEGLKAPGTIGGTTPGIGNFTSVIADDLTGDLTSASVDINGGTIDGTSVGATFASSGAFTTLSASSTVSGTGFSNYLKSPPAIGNTAANTGAFTTLSATTLNGLTVSPTATGDNVVVGSECLQNITASGTVNIGVGYLALQQNRSGRENIAVGAQALRYFTYSGSGGNAGKNIAIGAYALTNATAGVATLGAITGGSGYVDGAYSAVQLTYLSGTAVVSGGTYPTANITVASGAVTAVTLVNKGTRFVDTTAVLTAPNTSLGGSGSGFTVLVATLAYAASNSAIGTNALGLTTLGSNNIGVGTYAGYYNTTGSSNVALGYQAMFGSGTGNGNIAIGQTALAGCSSGGRNTCLGFSSGSNIVDGNYNTILGGYLGVANLGNTCVISDGQGNIRLWVDSNYNVGLGGVTTFGTSASKVLSLGTGAAPSSGVADTIQIYSTDLSAGNTIPSIYTEGTAIVSSNTVTTDVSNRIAIRINGTVYYLLAASTA